MKRAFRAAALLLCGCSPGGQPGPGGTFSPDERTVYVYRCEGDQRFTVRPVGDSVRVQWELVAGTLQRVISASGARYAGDGLTFWSRGSDAGLESRGATLVECRGERAETPWEVSRLLGYDFRAVGQEPGWAVAIDLDRRMHVLAEYGEVEFFTSPPAGAPIGDPEQRFAAEGAGRQVTVTIREGPCDDVMSGEHFPYAVHLTLDALAYEGCGRWLR